MASEVNEYEEVNIKISLKRAERIFDMSGQSLIAAAENGRVKINDDRTIDINECVKYAAELGIKPNLVRALSVLSRLTPVFSSGQIATLLGCSNDFVNKLIDAGDLPGYRLPSIGSQKGARRVFRMDLAEYISKHPCALAQDMGLKVKKGKVKA